MRIKKTMFPVLPRLRTILSQRWSVSQFRKEVCETCSTTDVLNIRKELGLDVSFYKCDCAEIDVNIADHLFLVTDRYRGIHLVLKSQPNPINSHSRRAILKFVRESIDRWKSNRNTAVWLHVPIELSGLIPVLMIQGFRFHHAEGDYSSLCLWLDQNTETRIPIAASHQVGVGGCCIDVSNNRMLLVKESSKNRQNPWKIPGGFSLLGENFERTAEREVFEETGIPAVFQSVLGFRQQHNFPGAFRKSDIYIVVKLKPLNLDITPCPREIEDCKWMDLEEAKHRDDINPITAQIVRLIGDEIAAG